VERLAWHGIAAESREVTHISKPSSRHLLRVAQELGADLLVVGGYGNGPLREAVFGGVTRALIGNAELPMLMMH
jgi:nucleotide-binding universal stress UspA family protein